MAQNKDAFAYILAAIRDGRASCSTSATMDRPDGLLFVANILSRRSFELYTERNEEFPRLVLFLERPTSS